MKMLMETNKDIKSKKQFRKLCELAIRYKICYCYLCGQPILDGEKWNLDHVLPRSKKGKTVPENLRPTHYECNASKSNLTLGEYRQIQQLMSKHREKQR